MVLIPQSLAYAELAGLPAYYGLYAALVPPVVAAFFVSSPYLQTGPVAMTSVLTFGALAGLAVPQSPTYVALAALLAIVVGVVRTMLGLVRAGWVAYLMSQPMLKGFTTGAAILILSSQLPTALGVVTENGDLLGRAFWAIMHFREWDVASVGLSAITLILVLGGRRLHPVFPGVLVAVIIGIAFSRLTGYAGPMVGEIPRALPPFSLDLPWTSSLSLLVPGAVIALVGFAEPSAIARTFAAQDRAVWSPNEEFVSQGAANIAAGLSGGFPVGGSFSRSSINRLAGGKTRWSGAFVGLVVLLALPVAGILSALPRAVLAATVIAAVLKLIAIRPLIRIVRMTYLQGLVAWATFLLTLALAPRIDLAVIIGIGLAILVHLWRELRVHVRARYHDGTLMLEPQGVLFFASAPGLEEALIHKLAQYPLTGHLDINLNRLGRIDYSGALVIKDLADEAEQAGLTVSISAMQPQARRIFKKVLGEDSSLLR